MEKLGFVIALNGLAIVLVLSGIMFALVEIKRILREKRTVKPDDLARDYHDTMM